MKHEQINNYDNHNDYDNSDKEENNPFDVLTAAPKDLQEDPQLSNDQINALMGSLKSKLAKRDLYQNVLPKEYFDEIEQTIRSLEERQPSVEEQDSEPNEPEV